MDYGLARMDSLEDLKYVIDKTEGVDALSYFNAAAKIMTVVNYQRLVDAFGDIPYTDALRGAEGITAPIPMMELLFTRLLLQS